MKPNNNNPTPQLDSAPQPESAPQSEITPEPVAPAPSSSETAQPFSSIPSPSISSQFQFKRKKPISTIVLVCTTVVFAGLAAFFGYQYFTSNQSNSSQSNNTDETTESTSTGIAAAQEQNDTLLAGFNDLISPYLPVDTTSASLVRDALLSGNIHNEKYMALVAYNATPSTYISASYQIDDRYTSSVYEETLDKQIHQMFGSNYNMPKQNMDVTCPVNFLYEQSFFHVFTYGCGGAGSLEAFFKTIDYDTSGDLLNISAKAAIYHAWEGGNEIKTIDDKTVYSKDNTTDSSYNDARNYFSDHLDEFDTYTFTFKQDGENLVLDSISHE